MDTAAHFNVVAYIASAVVYFVIGYVWYGNAIFGKRWAAETGISMDGGTFPVLPMIGQLVSTLLYALGVYMVVMLGKFGDPVGAITAGVSIVIFFVVPINAGTLLFIKKPVLFLIDAGYQAIGAIVMAFILALWK
jgi:hypothetical protein